MSEIKVNKISPRSGTEVTLGDSGDTFTIPSGATINNQGTATNFGATGSASWNTTVKTSTFTAVAGEGYFVNTTGGAVSVNLPAGTAGAVVGFKDYANTFDTNAVTLVQNGSDKIGGSAVNAILTTEGIAVTLVFIDSTQGWLVTDSGLQDEASGPQYITATGGTITTVCTDYKVHTFTGPGTFTVCNAGNAAGSNTVSYMVVAGGGSGGAGSGGGSCSEGGGGGAGGFREGKASTDCYSASPLNAPAGVPVTIQGYSITVGAGGATNPDHNTAGNPGSNSIFSTITSNGGGFGGSRNHISTPASRADNGGSGGGSGQADDVPSQSNFGSGNTPPVSPSQGNNGGKSAYPSSPAQAGGGGGGGATVVGSNATPGPSVGGPGGAGATTSINATPTAFAGGGGGAGESSPSPGGAGGGGQGAVPGVVDNTAGTANTGGGGGGGGGSKGIGEAGGSGIVIIRYKFQN